MLEGKPAIVLSYSLGYQEEIAKPVAEGLAPHGFRAVLVAEEPLPAGVDSNPNDKVEWYFRHSDMAVFLATPEDRLESGEIHTRPNIIDEHRLGQQLDHLKHKLLVFKAAEVKLPSNINPVYERLPASDPAWVVAKIVEQARAWGVLPAEPEPDIDQSLQSSEETAPTTILVGLEDDGATAQAVAAVQRTVSWLSGSGGDPASLRRAELAVAGLSADNGGADTLGVRLANRIFTHRHELRLRQSERLLLVRTYLHHTRDENVPGMFWMKDLDSQSGVELLTGLAQDHGDEEVAGQALVILGKLGAPSSSDEARLLLQPFLSSAEFRMRWAALDYLRERREASLRDLLDDPHLLERDRHRASQTAALLDLPRRPGSVMERYIEDAYVRDASIEQGLLRAASRISRSAVERAVRSSVRDVRQLGLRLAGRKQSLSPQMAHELIVAEKSPRMRLQVVQSLLASGESVDFDLLDFAAQKRDDDITELAGFDEQRAIEVDIGLTRTPERLKKELRWSVRGPSIYEALGRRDQTWADRHVRRDLSNDFARLKEELRNEIMDRTLALVQSDAGRPLRAEELDTVARTVDAQWSEWASGEKLGTFLSRLFRRAALRVLVEAGRPSDVRFARQFAADDDQDIRVEALRLFNRFGTSHDAFTVLRLVGQVYDDDDRRLAAETALRLSFKKHKLDVLAELRENHTVRVWAVERLADVQGGVTVGLKLLLADRPEVRLAAAEVVWGAVPPERADDLLSLYMEHRHFYNVVRAIDRRLYTPGWLRGALAEAE